MHRPELYTLKTSSRARYHAFGRRHALACCKIQIKIDFNRFSFFLGMYLGFFDRKILDVLIRKGEPLTLAKLVMDSAEFLGSGT